MAKVGILSNQELINIEQAPNEASSLAFSLLQI
jgi:hypothetical protein